MVSAAQFKAMKNNKRKREVQNNEPDFEEYEAADNNDTSSSEEEESESDAASTIDDEDDDNASAFAVSKNGSLVKGKGRATGEENTLLDDEEARPATKQSTFRQKTLILSSRGITHRMRHMMKDIANLLPHSKTDAKLDTKHQLSLLNELADLSNCSSALFFEARRHADLYLWTAMTPNGPSVRFHLLNSHTMDELKMTGNCLKGSRPIVVFDDTFDQEPHWRIIKEVLMQIFAVPKTARRAKPFVDHVTSFSVGDGKVWFRNYQIVHDSALDLSDDAAVAEEAKKASAQKKKGPLDPLESMSLNEIGPRFVLVPVKIFEGSFGGANVWENKAFVAPQAKLAAAKLEKAVAYRERKGAEGEIKGKREFLKEQAQADKVKSGKAAIERSKVFA